MHSILAPVLCVLVSVTLVANAAGAGQAQERGPVTPVEPIAAIVEAFRTHDLVAVSDPHGNLQMHTFLRALVRDPRMTAVVDDIVVEIGNARYQALVDRYVTGAQVTLDDLRPVWQNTTVPNQLWADDELFAIVRAVNAARPRDRHLRILLGDPPIDWSVVRTRDDHFRWLSLRDSYPAALIQVEVLAKRRKALVVYGHMHFQRRQLASNLDMSGWRAHTLVSLLEQATPARVFTIWRLDDTLRELEPAVASWNTPGLATVRGTRLGAADVSLLSPARSRITFRDGAMVPVPQDQWRTLAIEDQLDAVLYLGAPDAMLQVEPPARACAGAGFLDERLRRIALTGIPAFEADRVRRLCGQPAPQR